MKLYGKSRPLKLLESFARSGRMPHGILYTGESGIGKSVMADYTAGLLLCRENREKPCGVCEACLKSASNVHPDVFHVKTMMENGKYKAEALRSVISSAVKRPNDGDLKVYIFQDCDTMSPICQNTLLKFIEEPMSFNRFIFTASSVETVLETILSRLVSIEIDLPSQEECSFILMEQGASEKEAGDIISVYGCNPGQAVGILENKKSSGKNDDGADLILKTVIKITDGLFKTNEYETAAALSDLRDHGASGRDVLGKILVLLQGILRDSIIYKCGDGQLTGCYRDGAERLARACGLKELISAQKKISEYIQCLEQNPNLTLACAAYSSGIYSALHNQIK